MLANIQSVTNKLKPRLIEIYRHLHAHPELSGKEYETGAYIAGVLNSFGIAFREQVGNTGLVSEVAGKGIDNRVLAIRVDMDALPIQEETELSFSSKHEGVMHACGHDLHTTVGLGTAIVLSEIQEHLPGKVRFIFQPAEEIVLGATWMLSDRVLNQTSAIIGIHSYPSIKAGSVGVRYGTLTAASDCFEIEVLGETCDGGEPYNGVDSIWIAAQVVLALQQFINQTYDPLETVVLTIGTINGGNSKNSVAEKAQMKGTVRCLSAEIRESLPQKIDELISNICTMHGAKHNFIYKKGVPPVKNDNGLTSLIETTARSVLGDDRVQILPKPSLGGEDFSFYLDHCPGAMFRLGVRNPANPYYPLHHPKFEIDELAIETAVLTLSYLAFNFWGSKLL